MTRLISAWYEEQDPFDGLFSETVSTKDPNELKKGDVLILWGGEDISPAIYNESPTKYTGARGTLSSRDKCEVAFAKRAIELDVPIIGVCRGAQLMCAIVGGSLWQHVNGHASCNHKITTDKGEVLGTNSIHHQMMRLENTKHHLIAWSTTNLSDCYYSDGDTRDFVEVEPEIVYFPDVKCLAIQGHPEYASPKSEFVQYCKALVKEYLNV